MNREVFEREIAMCKELSNYLENFFQKLYNF